MKWVSADKKGAWDIASNSQKIDMAGNDNKFKKFFKEDAVKYQVAGNPAYSSTDKDKRKQLIGSVVAGFSAAMGIRKFIKSMGDSGSVQKVYLTGATWPTDVADFRLKNKKIWEEWYDSPHTQEELLSESVYGLTELNLREIKSARLVAVPGCYPTCSLLGLSLIHI